MKFSDIKELATHPAGFIIFVLGYKDNYLVIPAKHLIEELPNHIEGLTENGFYHFNLHGNAFEQLPDWNLRLYADKIELIPFILKS